jgi:hypothetical protein
MRATASGAFARFETISLLTAAEAGAAMRKAKEAKVDYRAPNA